MRILWFSTKAELYRLLFRSTVSVLVVSVFLSLAAYGYENARQGEIQYSYLSQALDRNVTVRPLVEFLDGIKPVGRTFNKSDHAAIGKAVTEAWSNLTISYASGEERFLKDHFDDTALEKLKQRLKVVKERGMEEGYIVLNQIAEPRFFHADGSVFEMKSDNTLVTRFLFDKSGEEIKYLALSSDCTRQILFLQTVGWKIRNHEQDCSRKIPLKRAAPKVNSLQMPLKGINYYPAKTPWNEFWSGFNAPIIKADMERMELLGVNSVRIFIPFGYFTDPLTRGTALKRFEHFLFLAGQKQIQVMPTLFDFRGTYAASGWSEDYRYLSDLLVIMKKYENVSIVDLKNEPDLDYKHFGKALVDAWLITFSAVIRKQAPELSVTIGWLHSHNASRMHEFVDVVSYHEYGEPSLAGNIYQSVKTDVLGKPVMVTEIGKPSWSVAAGFPFSDNSQAQWLKQGLNSLRNADGIFVWTLHDFEYADTAGIASLPWRRAFQASYGLIDQTGSPKPSAQIFKAFEIQENWNNPEFRERIKQ